MINAQMPSKVALCGNAIRVKLNTNDHLAVTGQLAISELIFAQALVADEQVIFAWDDKSVTFTCKAVPDDSGLQFKDNAEALTLANWIDYPFQAFQSNYHITANFLVQKLSDRIVFTSREKSADLTLTITSPAVKTSVTQQAGVTPKLKDFFLLHTQIILGSKNDPIEVKLPDALTPTLAGDAMFDIADLFKADFEPAFSHPQSGARIIKRTGMVKKFDIGYFHSSGTVFTPGKISYTEEFFALLGGESDKRLQDYEEAGSDFWTDLQSSKRFLTTGPAIKTVSPSQPERLYFFNYVNAASFTARLNVRAYFDDGTNQLLQLDQLLTSRYEVLELQVGYDVLALGNFAKKVVKYEVWITNASTVVSEIRTFLVDYTIYQNLRYIVFRNSLGGYDTIRCTGTFVREVETKRNVLARQVNDDLRNTFEYFTRRSHKVDIFHGNVGWTDKKYFRYLEDFFLSEDCYLLDGDSSDRLVVTTDSSTFDWDEPTPRALEFDALWGVPDFFFRQKG